MSTATFTASIYTLTGDELATGLDACTLSDQAIDAARRIAAERGESVHLIDDDGEWIVPADGGPATLHLQTDADWRAEAGINVPANGE